MKKFLVILIVALVGVIAWVRHVSIRPSESHRAIIAGLTEELEASMGEQDRLRNELAAAKAEIARRNGEGGSVAITSEPVPNHSSGTESTGSSAPPTNSLDQRLAGLKAIYDSSAETLEKERRTIELSRADAQARRDQLSNAPLTFSEQTTISDSEGFVTGNRGVRTSQADRERTMKVRAEELEKLDAAVKAEQDKLSAMDERRRLLDSQFRDAVARARVDLTGSGQ